MGSRVAWGEGRAMGGDIFAPPHEPTWADVLCWVAIVAVLWLCERWHRRRGGRT